MPKVIDELQYIVDIEKILKSDGIPLDYVDMDLDWLRSRREVWTRSKWRVGVVGITSSGKSTLINALCGEYILPKEARPTSGVLVSCKKGENRQATIIKKSGFKEVLTGSKLNRQEIAKYADEEYNPNNRYEIDEICLEFPGFTIGEGIEIVDSPGLDAFGLEAHEEITLRQLIPSVDIVIYLTTTKANSDKRNLEVLNRIVSENKPVIIVQNFIDCIEPEYTTGGIIRESKEEVAKRLMRRVKGILSQTENGRLKSAPVIQVSALWALQAIENNNKELCQQSNIETLIQLIIQASSTLKSQRDINRIEQISNHIKEMKQRFNNDCNSYRGEKVATGVLENLNNRKDEFKNFSSYLDRSFGELDSIKEVLVKDFNTLMAKVRDASSEGTLQDLGNKMKSLALKTQKQTFKIIDEMDKREDKIFASFNLSSEDKSFGRIQLPSDSKLKVYKKTTTYTVEKRRRKSDGFLWLKKLGRRITGESDYETYYEEKTETVIDLNETRKAYREFSKGLEQKLGELIKTWQRRRLQAREVLKEELERLDKIKIARKNKPSDISVIEGMISSLSRVELKYDKNSTSLDKVENRSISEKLKIEEKNIELGKPEKHKRILMNQDQFKYTSSLINLANRKKRVFFQSFIYSNIEANLKYGKKLDRLVLLGYDREEMDRFFVRVFGVEAKFSSAKEEVYRVRLAGNKYSKLLEYIKEVVFIDASISRLDDYDFSNSLTLDFVDVHQYGLTQKYLMENNHYQIFRKYPYALVIQSIIEYENEDKLSEAYIYYRELCEFIDKQDFKCIVNNKEPFYTALFYVADLFSWNAGIGEEQAAMKRLLRLFPDFDSVANREKAGKLFKEVSKMKKIV